MIMIDWPESTRVGSYRVKKLVSVVNVCVWLSVVMEITGSLQYCRNKTKLIPHFSWRN